MEPYKSPLNQLDDYLVCTCMGVMYSEIVSAISAGCTDFNSLSNTLGVGTGCNSCVPEVHEILANELKKSQK